MSKVRRRLWVCSVASRAILADLVRWFVGSFVRWSLGVLYRKRMGLSDGVLAVCAREVVKKNKSDSSIM